MEHALPPAASSLNGGGGTPETPPILHKIPEIAAVLWSYIEDFERVRNLKRKPSIDRLCKMSHAVTQLATCYLKTIEVGDLAKRLERLEAAMLERGEDIP